ncbi:site-specific integrase [Streptomyces coeruleorubidus]|uniref:site-specific integrase n=1 Tax=Streptomyces coeruleorubidus TaxID=116188 RepID=UPI0033F6C7F4
MILSFFSSRGWDVEHRPLIPEEMPVLVDDDPCFEDGPAAPRPAAVVNRWLRELPASGAPAPSSWENYARAVKEWMEFLAEHGVGLFDSRERLKAGLSRYAEHRAASPLKARFVATTWSQHMSILSLFYRWAINEGYATAEPFTYRAARALFTGTGREVKVNLAVRRTPKPHVTIKYLEPDFTELFRKGLRGLAPDGSQDTFHGREMTRNAAVGDLALATGPAAAGVHLPAVLGDPHAASGADPGADSIPGAGRDHQGQEIPHPPGSPMRHSPRCTTTWSWTGRPQRRAAVGARRGGGASRCWCPSPMQRIEQVLERFDPAVLTSAAAEVGDHDAELPLRP